ncbi:MAG: hypothetical protein IJY33_04685, partial [Oscillospiraceae bacterium]|nr:hypothetical protein [Oscillospiraceae bacterium]
MSTRRTTSKKSTTRRKSSTSKKAVARRESNAKQNSRRQLWALILFGASLILGFLTFLEGENFWSILHKGFFGLFGIAAYLVAPLVLAISILLAFEQSVVSVKSKIAQALTLVTLASGAFHIFFGIVPEGSNFFVKLINLFELGVERRGGGLLASLFGWSLTALFGKIAASVVIVIVIVIFLFIIFGITIGDIINFCKASVKKPVEHIEKAYQEHLEQREEQSEDDEDEYAPAIDISLGPDSAELEEKSRKRSEKVKKAKHKLLNQDEPEEVAEAEDIPDEEPAQVRIDDLFESKDDEDEKPKDEPTSEEKLEQTSLYKDGIENKVYTFPPLTLLSAPKIQTKGENESEIQQNAEILMDTLSSFGVKTRLLGAARGPAVTRY